MRFTLSYDTRMIWPTKRVSPDLEGAKRSRRGGSSSTTALAGRESQWPGLPALADTIARHGIPAHLLHEVIEGVSMDIRTARFTRRSQSWLNIAIMSRRSSACAACTSGAIDREGGRAERLAENCGLALQLTNIIRDVRDDARNGRIYLPSEDLERFGVAPVELTVDWSARRPSALRCSRSRQSVRLSITTRRASSLRSSPQ